MSEKKSQTSHASAPGGPLPTQGDDAGGDGAVRGLPAKWETIGALHAENAESWRSRSTRGHPHTSSVASREGMAEAYRAAAADLRAALSAESPPTAAPPRPNPTHRCKVCGALWIKLPPAPLGGWSLWSRACGPCCDNVEMGEQIEPIRDFRPLCDPGPWGEPPPSSGSPAAPAVNIDADDILSEPQDLGPLAELLRKAPKVEGLDHLLDGSPAAPDATNGSNEEE